MIYRLEVEFVILAGDVLGWGGLIEVVFKPMEVREERESRNFGSMVIYY